MAEFNNLIVSKKSKHTVILKKKKFYLILLDEVFFVALQANNKKNFHLDPYNNAYLTKKKTNKKTQNFLAKKLNIYFFMWDLFFFKKLKFAGKNYRISKKKKKKSFIMHFGKSHKIRLLAQKFLLVKKMSKYKMLVLSSCKFLIKICSNKIFRIRTVNCYTKRGLRIIRKQFIKRKGKKG